ncbi:MAG: dTDP-4-dehydrorhamnose 3,5-epimerase [bacterium]
MERFVFKNTSIEGLYTIKPKLLQDNRGFFERIYCKKEFKSVLKKDIKQVNYSLTKTKGSIRGMHYQNPPMAEAKIIKCVRGSIYDVAVDLRKGSPTFLKWHAEIISENNPRMFFVPEGFAHGFQTLKDNTELIYFHTEYFSEKHYKGIKYNDPRIAIKWELELTEISDKDMSHPLIKKDFDGIVLPMAK